MTKEQQVAADAIHAAWHPVSAKRMFDALVPGALVRDNIGLLTTVLERIEEDRDANSTHCGSWFGGDPRDFAPDPECSTVEERELHRLAVAAADRDEPGARDLPRGFLAGTLSQDQRFGLGTTTFRDADGDGVIAALRRLVGPETSPTRAEIETALTVP